MARGRRAIRIVRHNILIEDFLTTVGGGQRVEILRVLGASPKCVREIAAELYLRENAVSRDLGFLQELGLVVARQVKTKRIYGLSERVRVFRRDSVLQLAIIAASSLSVLLQFDESADDRFTAAPLPVAFVDFHATEKSSKAPEVGSHRLVHGA